MRMCRRSTLLHYVAGEKAAPVSFEATHSQWNWFRTYAATAVCFAPPIFALDRLWTGFHHVRLFDEDGSAVGAGCARDPSHSGE